MIAAKTRRKEHERQLDDRRLEKARAVLQHQSRIGTIRTAYRALLETQLLLIEAKSDVAYLKEKNTDIKQRLEAEKENVQTFAREAAQKKAEAREALAAVHSSAADRESLLEASHGRTLETVEAEMAAERAKLDVIQANNPQALQEYETWSRRIEKEQADHATQEARLKELDDKIARIQGEWEPRVDELVGRINEAFGYNFEQISCAGEVGVHKDEDFDKWAIEIRVKFR